MEYKENMTNEQHAAWHELQDIEKWFKDNDWKVNKIITKEWSESDIRWITYLQERNLMRHKQDQLLVIFGT